MKEQFIFFLRQIKEKTVRLISKIDDQNKEILKLKKENKKLSEALEEHKKLNDRIRQEKLEQEYEQFTNSKDKNKKLEITKKIDNTIRVIDKTIMLLNK